MVNFTPIQQILIAVAGLAAVWIGVIVISRSGKQSQNYQENARIGFSVVMGAVIIAIGVGFTAIYTGPGRAVADWVVGLFS